MARIGHRYDNPDLIKFCANMALWKIWYTNGSTFCDQDGGAWDAPRTGVQLVVTKWQNSPAARRLIGPLDPAHCVEPFAMGQSYYCWYSESGHWLNHDLPAMVRVYLTTEPRPSVLMGEYVDENVLMVIRQAAGNDPYTRLIAEG